ncbi:MAG: DUF4173 domain-containing protein [bacterium]|nr:DUF4173 domain-containing protein [bacterium]
MYEAGQETWAREQSGTEGGAGAGSETWAEEQSGTEGGTGADGETWSREQNGAERGISAGSETWARGQSGTEGGAGAGGETWSREQNGAERGVSAGSETWPREQSGAGGGAGADGETWARGQSDMEGGTFHEAAERKAAQGEALAGAVPPEEASSREDTEETKRMRENFGFFGPVTLLYAAFYAFCMFRNGSGVTFPFFVAGSLLYLYFSFTRLRLTLKRGSIFYAVAVMLLGVSTFCTDDARIIFFNKLGVFLLLMSLLLRQFFDTSGWGLGKFLGSICRLSAGGLGEWKQPFWDVGKFWEKWTGKEDRRLWAVGVGFLAGIPLVLVVLVLLSGADAFFRQMTRCFLDAISVGSIFEVLFRILFLFLISYGLFSFLCRRRIKEEVRDRKNGEPVTAITVAVMLTAVYLVFSVVQIAGLFLGKLQLPAGYTYAAYAREGFFQLLAVSFLNLVIVLTFMSFFKESRALKGVLTLMSLCTFVMIASSAMRMIIYITCYYLTFLRLLVLWSLGLLALLFVGVILSIYRKKFPLFRYSVAVVTVLYLGLSFAHPDAVIARVNLAYTEEKSSRNTAEYGPYDDFGYLAGLCADAAPVLVPYLKEQGYDLKAFQAENAMQYRNEMLYTEDYRAENSFGYSWMRRMQLRTGNPGIRTFNVSRWRMMKLIRDAAR